MRRGKAAEWAAKNPILGDGEPGYETDSRKLKVGDGLSYWNNLPYVVGGEIDGSLIADGTISESALGGNVTSAGLALLTDANASAQRSSLGLGTAATSSDAAFQPAATGTPDGTKFLRDDNVWAAVSGGSDPWTNVILGSDETNSTTANTVTSLAFTPAANKTYAVEVNLLLRTATATVGPRPGFSFPTGLTDSGAWMQVPNSATASAQRWWGTTTAANAASTGVPDTTSSWMAIGGALLIVGGSPSGDFAVTLATETAATNVTLKAGSYLRYREIS